MIRQNSKILVLATMGNGSRDEDRIKELLAGWRFEIFPFDRSHKVLSGLTLFRKIQKQKPDLVVMEGSGLAGGFALILGRLLFRVPYVVSTGDAIGPYVASRHPLLGMPFGVYERVLCRFSAGIIGWTPYLVGRALTFGARRAMTAPGWAPLVSQASSHTPLRAKMRAALGIAQDEVLIGIAGSLDWNSNKKYCYGYELVQAMHRVRNPKVRAVIVGSGTGLDKLRGLASSLPAGKVIFTGRVMPERVAGYLAAMDLASLPQSCDGVGSYRYTIKMSEYLAAHLPVVTGEIPMAYDLDDGGLWRVSGDAPWSLEYIEGLARLLDELEPSEILRKQAKVSVASPVFDQAAQMRRVGDFIADLLK